MLKRIALLSIVVVYVLVPRVLLALQLPSEPQGGFVPISELPESEKLPAAPFLISAYVIVWMIALFYIWTIWRRVNKLEGEFKSLEQRMKSSR